MPYITSRQSAVSSWQLALSPTAGCLLLTEDFDELVVNQAVRRDQVTNPGVPALAAPVRQAATGFGKHQRGSPSVPGLEIHLPVGVEPAHRHVGDIQGGRAGPAHPLALPVDPVELAQVVVGPRGVVVWKA